MAASFQRIRNFNVSVKEIDGKVLFMRKLVPGGSEHSFGIHVAEMAGMPRSIVKRAGTILKEMEAGNAGGNGISRPGNETVQSMEGMQMSFFQLDDPVLSQIRDQILQIFSDIIPAKWFIIMVKKIMIQGAGISAIIKELSVLTGMMVFLLWFSIKKFRTRL